MVESDVLRRYPYFANLDSESLKKLAAITSRKTIAAGEQIFREGDEADNLYVVIRGEVEVQYVLATEDLWSVDVMRDGDLLQWSAIIEPYKATAAGLAKKETLLLCINAEKLRELFDTDPYVGCELSVQVAKQLARRLDKARNHLARIAELAKGVREWIQPPAKPKEEVLTAS
jgi:CRP-like cAMP-binding protein